MKQFMHPYGLTQEEVYDLFTDTMTNFEELSEEVYELRNEISIAVQDLQDSVADIDSQFRQCCSHIMKLQSDLSFRKLWNRDSVSSEKSYPSRQSESTPDNSTDDAFPF